MLVITNIAKQPITINCTKSAILIGNLYAQTVPLNFSGNLRLNQKQRIVIHESRVNLGIIENYIRQKFIKVSHIIDDARILSPSASPSPSISFSPSLSLSPSPSISFSPSLSHSPSLSPSPSISFSPSPSPSIDEGLLAALLAYWRMENASYLDDGPSGFTLTANGTPTVAAGKWGNAVSLNGSSYLSRASGPAVGFGSPFSFSTWFNIQDNGTSQALLYRFSFGSGWYVLVAPTNGGRINFSYPSHNQTVDVGASLFGQWNHVVCQRGATHCRIYFNNVVVSEVSTVSNSGLGPGSLGIGGLFGGGGSNVLGSLDDMIVLQKELDAAEVDRLYTGPLIP